MQKEVREAYILKIPEDERFVAFVDFNQFTDIGFYPEHLSIECCSHFLYITTTRGVEGDILNTKLNLLLVDPYYDHIKMASFKSTGYIGNEIFKNGD